MKQTFSRNERLRGRLLITSLFKSGTTFYESPFRVTWMTLEKNDSGPYQVLMSVPKHNFRKAVDRNLLRRRMKEAFRLNKHLLAGSCDGKEGALAVCITFTAKEIIGFDRIQQKIILILQRLMKENEKVTG